MRILKTLLDNKSVPSDFLKYNEDQNLIYYNYPNHFSTDIDNAGLTDDERKALDKLFLNLVYFYPRRLKENGKLGRAHINRAYNVLHNIK